MYYLNNKFLTTKSNSKIMGEYKTEFSCNRCGYCCTDPSTQINMTLLDIKWMSDITKMSVKEMFEKDVISFIPFVKTQDFTLFEVDFGIKRPCPLYKENGCTVYEGRPMNCRIFPYWFITNNVQDDLECTKNLKLDPMVHFKYKMYERMLGQVLIDEGKRTDEFIKRVGITQTIDISKEEDVPRIVKLFKKAAENDPEKAQKYAQKLMKIADKKVKRDELLKKVYLVEEEIEKLNFDEKIDIIINAEGILDSEIENIDFKMQNTY